MTEPKHIPLPDFARFVEERADVLRRLTERVLDALVVVDDAHDVIGDACYCPPCPGKGLDGNGMNHCAECCWGSRVIADIDCPKHGKGQ